MAGKNGAAEEPEIDPTKQVEGSQQGAEGTGIIEGEEPDVELQAKDAADQLKKQLDDLRRSEADSRQRAVKAEAEREQALQLANQRGVELSKQQLTTSQSRFEAVTSAMAAAQSAADRAQTDLESAISNGDVAAQADAHRRLARSEADLSRLEDGKAAIEQDLQQERARAQYAAQQQANDPLARANIPENAKTWLRSHPDYLNDQRKNAKLQSLHWDVLEEGHQAFSAEYFDSIERHLGLKAAARAEEDDEPVPPQRRLTVSAPVTRDPPGNTPQRASVKSLNKLQREAAAIAGVTEVEYAKQLDVLADAKARGLYQGGQ